MNKKKVYSLELKMKAIHLREEGWTFKAITEELDITNVSQAKQWWYWYRDGEIDRLSQPIGKQYSFGHGPEGSTLEENLIIRNRILENQIKILKKYSKMERKWYEKYLLI